MISHADNRLPMNFRKSIQKIFREDSVYSIDALSDSRDKCAVRGKQLHTGLSGIVCLNRVDILIPDNKLVDGLSYGLKRE